MLLLNVTVSVYTDEFAVVEYLTKGMYAKEREMQLRMAEG